MKNHPKHKTKILSPDIADVRLKDLGVGQFFRWLHGSEVYQVVSDNPSQCKRKGGIQVLHLACGRLSTTASIGNSYTRDSECVPLCLTSSLTFTEGSN